MKNTKMRKVRLIAIVLLLCPLSQAQKFSDLPGVVQTRIAALVASHIDIPVKLAKVRLRASDGHLGNLFGFGVAVSGNTVVVASPAFQGNYGGAYVFVKPQTGWKDMTQTAKLSGSDWYSAEGFYNVAVSGDTIVAGPTSSGSGAYVFVKPPGGWVNMTQTATLNTTEQLYGSAGVAIAGDVVALGYPIAAPQQTGAAAVFVKPTGGWHDMTQTAILTASDGAIGDQLGWGIATDGKTIVVGAPFATVKSVKWAGALYVFVRPATGWSDMTQTAKLTPTYEVGGQLGYTTSISGNTVVSSAEGNVYVFARPETGWADMTPSATLSPPIGQGLISCAAISSGVVVAGSTGPYPQNYGEVYAFLKPQDGWQTTSSPNALYVPNPDGGPQELGYSIAVNGTTAVSGAAWFDNGTGAAYVFAPRK